MRLGVLREPLEALILVVELPGHLYHSSSKSPTIEQALRCLVLLRRIQHDARDASGLERLDGCVEQTPADGLTT